MSSRIKSEVKKLFEFWCEIDSNRAIVDSFPEKFHDERTAAEIPDFVFPCELEESESVQSYSFVLTTDDSKWRFGFCRHDPKAKSAFVFASYLPWHDIFLRLLSVLAELRKINNIEFRTFISDAYSRGVPDPGKSVKVFYNGGQNYFVFERPIDFQLPSIPQNHNLNLYYNFVDPKHMIAIFAAMLAERRIIFTSRRLDKLSSCIQAANAFLYPMVWQHIYIPLLPMKLKDYLSAPMPYLIGVPEPVLHMVTPDELGEVVLLNCDTKILENPFDDVNDMPTEVVLQMKKQLNQTNEHIGDRVSKIFLSVLVQLMGGYRDAVEFRDAGKVFNRERFIESRPSHLRPFLTKMMELQIFQQFIDERLEMLHTGLGFSDEFELETVRYAEKMKKRGRNYAFLKNVRDKTNPAVKSAVKSVKESSRGVKTAYKDLKSKFRDVTPPKNEHFRSHLTSNIFHDQTDVCAVKKSSATHHSAPSTPIISKRTVDDGIHYYNYEQYSNPETMNFQKKSSNQILPSSSSSQVKVNGFGSFVSDKLSNNRMADKSDSPVHSMCSSEMNLSQELQNHPLFKSPIVDRSLKPNSNLKVYQRILPQSSGISAYSKCVQKTALKTTNSMFDKPPDLKSPPIPRRTINLTRANNVFFSSKTQRFDQKNKKDESGLFTSLMSKRESLLPSSSGTCSCSVISEIPILTSSNIKKGEPFSSLNLHKGQSTTSMTTNVLANNSQRQTNVKDLISLNDNIETSFEVEDFDPLNQNARPIPNTLYSSRKNNNHNPFVKTQIPAPLQPPPLPSSSPPKMLPVNEEFELLRQYGLDQFTLENTKTVESNKNASSLIATKTDMSNWTKFD